MLKPYSLGTHMALIQKYLAKKHPAKINLAEKFPKLRSVVLGGAVLAYLGGMGVLGSFAVAAGTLPDPKRLWEDQRPISVQIVDRYGRDVAIRGASAGQAVDLDKLPFHIPMTILATEDRRFYNHIGVDPLGILRAAWINFRQKSYAQGGSTLTQQLTKNVFLTPDKTLGRKAQEIMLSIWLERDFTKKELLEMYLSRVYFGSGSWGLEAASAHYFGKPAAEMSLAETALMAGLLRAPSRSNPIANFDKAKNRQDVVLGLMVKQDLLSEGLAARAKSEPIHIHQPANITHAQYFIDWIWADLEDKIGIPTQDIVVQTTLDIEAQQAAKTAVAAHLNPERGANQGAVVSLDGTGAVRAMVGGADYTQSQFNRATQAKRQPGSAFKPFVYLAALRAGLSPWDMRIDGPITIEDWSPKNFSEKYKGRVSLQTALAQSLNTVAVSLTEEVGRNNVVQTAAQMGIEGWQPYRSLALGAQLSTPLDMAESYLPFSNWGMRHESYGIISISTAKGRPLYDYIAPEDKRVLSPSELADMNTMLIHAVEAGTGRRARLTGHQIAGKTGTTNDFRDAWFIGYAPDLVTAVWIGDDKNQAMSKVTGGSIPAKIFADTMKAQLGDSPEARLPVSRAPQWAKRDAQLNSLLAQIEGSLP